MSYKPIPNEDPNLDYNIDHDDDDDDEEEVNTTQPFQPGATSTPYTPGAAYHPGEAHEMTNLPREQSGSGDTIPDAPRITDFKARQDLIASFEDSLRERFPKVRLHKIQVVIGLKKPNVGKAVALGRLGGEISLFKQDNTLT